MTSKLNVKISHTCPTCGNTKNAKLVLNNFLNLYHKDFYGSVLKQLNNIDSYETPMDFCPILCTCSVCNRVINKDDLDIIFEQSVSSLFMDIISTAKDLSEESKNKFTEVFNIIDITNNKIKFNALTRKLEILEVEK